MTVTADLTLQSVEGDGLRFEARMGERAITLDGGAAAAAPTPMEIVLAAVGGCAAMDVIGILRKKRQRVTGYEVVVIGERVEEHPRVYRTIEVLHRLRGHDLSAIAVEEAIRLSDTKYCSVHAMLRSSVRLVSRYEILAA